LSKDNNFSKMGIRMIRKKEKEYKRRTERIGRERRFK
jgi:hypothetical protein